MITDEKQLQTFPTSEGDDMASSAGVSMYQSQTSFRSDQMEEGPADRQYYQRPYQSYEERQNVKRFNLFSQNIDNLVDEDFLEKLDKSRMQRFEKRLGMERRNGVSIEQYDPVIFEKDDQYNNQGTLINVYGVRRPYKVHCYRCNKSKLSQVTYHCTLFQWFLCITFMLSGLLTILCWCPFVVRKWHNVKHYCGGCKTFLGESNDF